MKGLFLLAMLLMVPSVAYYQKQYYAEVLQGRLAEEVRRGLIDGGVEEAMVELEWMDARIGGTVGTVEKREEVGRRVEAMAGVRLAPQGNGLRVRGWVGLERTGGRWTARGLLPKEFVIGLREGVEQPVAWDAELERGEHVEAPPGAVEWERFLEGYFQEAGDRGVVLKGGELTLRGEATQGLRSDWLAQASEVVPKERVREEFELRPSPYHFAGYVPESSRGAGEVKRLREEIGVLTVGFAEDSAELDADSREEVSELAGILLKAGKRLRLVVGVRVPEGAEGAVELADKRLAAVVALLGDYGVDESQLVKQVFVATLDGTPAGQVEFLLK